MAPPSWMNRRDESSAALGIFTPSIAACSVLIGVCIEGVCGAHADTISSAALYESYLETILLDDHGSLAVSGIISVFASDIRALFSKGKGRFDRFRLSRLETRLATLNTLHDNVYGLLLWLASDFLWVMALTWIAGFIVALFATFPKPNFDFGRVWVTSVAGTWLGTFSRVLPILSGLNHYGHARAELERKIDKLKNKPTYSTKKDVQSEPAAE
jgi:hypothetical protein